MKKKINIAIDGYSACGKSSTAKEVAKRLNYIYIDTGAMYRAVTYYFLQHNIDSTNVVSISKALTEIQLEFKLDSTLSNNHIYLNNKDIESEIRSNTIAKFVSEISTISEVRKKMVEQQQAMAKQNGVVMDGRDIGSVVLPQAELKFFMIADINIRTKRRQAELFEKTNELHDFESVKENLLYRDKIDSTRADSPLIQVADAIVIDTSNITLEEQIAYIVEKTILFQKKN